MEVSMRAAAPQAKGKVLAAKIARNGSVSQKYTEMV